MAVGSYIENRFTDISLFILADLREVWRGDAESQKDAGYQSRNFRKFKMADGANFQ